MKRTTRPIMALGLGLALTSLVACDAEPEDQLDAELVSATEPFHVASIERQLEAEHDVELVRVTDLDEELELSADGSEAPLLWTELSDVTLGPAEATCGSGHWEYKSKSVGCNQCEVDGIDGKKYEHFRRWCWDGAPPCGGCEGWQYSGWSCFQGCW